LRANLAPPAANGGDSGRGIATKLHALGYLAALVVAMPRWPYLLWGLPLVVIGLALRTWALGYLTKNAALCTSGPYAYTRNPLYLGSLFILAGTCVAANNAYLTAVAAFLAVFVYIFTSARRRPSCSACSARTSTPTAAPYPPSSRVPGAGAAPAPPPSPGSAPRAATPLNWPLGAGAVCAADRQSAALRAVRLVALHAGAAPVTYGLWW